MRWILAVSAMIAVEMALAAQPPDAAVASPPAPAPSPAPAKAPAPEPPCFPEALTFSKSGVFTLDELAFAILHMSPAWSGDEQGHAMRPADGFPRYQSDQYELEGEFHSVGHFRLRQQVRALDTERFVYEAQASSDAGVPTGLLALRITLPASRYAGQTLVVDGSAVELPERRSPWRILFGKEWAKKVQIATPTGLVSIQGPVDVLVQDERANNGNGFTMHLSFDPGKGMLTSAKLKLTLAFKAHAPADAASGSDRTQTLAGEARP